MTDHLDLPSSSLFPVSTGGFGDVYKVKLHDATQVAVKTMRVQINTSGEGEKHLKVRARDWYV
jgi:hypothetical protein